LLINTLYIQEHHLQAALHAYSQRTLSFKAEAEKPTFIPTPDAAGVVANYDELYPRNQFHDPATHIRFSDSLDDCTVGGLAGSFTYLLDERDAEWLAKYNAAVKGEGTSNGVTARTPARTARQKGKGKEVETASHPSIEIDEDVFELTVGLFEKWTDEQVSPYLHLAHDPEHFPDFSEYSKFFSILLPRATFANFQPPSYVPPPEKLVLVARAIYPWWKERRTERKGERIVPQLHVTPLVSYLYPTNIPQVLILEAQEKEDKTGGSPYTCFRKRDAKPMRKTRTNNVTHTEKLTRLRGELAAGLELAEMVLEREKLKRESAQMNRHIWRSRETLAECMKQLNTSAPGSVPPTDELLLVDRERKSRKRVETNATGYVALIDHPDRYLWLFRRIILAPTRRVSHVRPESVDPHSPLAFSGDMSQAFEDGQKWPSARYTGIQKEVDRELARGRKEDAFWEENVDVRLFYMLR